jgi:hypothetical protein
MTVLSSHASDDCNVPEIHVALTWTDELRRRVPTK